jgi:protease IV
VTQEPPNNQQGPPDRPPGPPQDDAGQPAQPPPQEDAPAPAAASSSSSPPPPPPPPARYASGYYEGPWPPEGVAQKKDGFWGVIWRTTTRTVIIATVGGLAFVFSIVVFFALMALLIASLFDFGDDRDPDELDTDFLFGDRDSENRLLAVRVEGVILGERRSESWFDVGLVYGYEIRDELRKAAREDDIAGVVLILSTPGGTIFGSQAIAEGVQEYQAATGKPVLAFVAGISASGGVWGMAPADRILADHGSLIGSIGVIMGPFTFYDGVIATEGGLFGGGITTTDGITIEYITAGRSKDVGNPFRPLTDEERHVFQDGIDAEYDAFVRHVAEQRDIAESRIRDEMGALIFDNAMAEAFGLIDGTADMYTAFDELASMVGLPPGDWRLDEVKRGVSFFGGLFENDLPPPVVERLLEPPEESCFPRGMALAYYGDPGQLCWR